VLPSGQVWECTTNGQRTFSDRPCGGKALVRQLNDINTMNATPALSSALSYAPVPEPAPEYPGSGYEPEYAHDSVPTPPVNVYWMTRGVPTNDRARHGHNDRPHHHEHGTPRSNPGSPR
jgi:hypothetical protein